MAESFPSMNPFNRNGVIHGELDFGQYSFAEDVEERRRVESDDVAGNPSSLGMVDEPSIQPGASFGENDGELQGNLVAPGTPLLSGGYANIFRGVLRSPDGTLTVVAVKTLKPIRPTSMSFLPNAIALQQRREKSLKREVTVWARLRHPNIQPFLGLRTQPEPCLVSQWCENGDLVSYLDNNPNLTRTEKLEPLVQAARGLAFLHAQSPPICHGDIKPENALMNGCCEAALSDFGLSRVIQESDASTGLTTGGGAKGSQRYMAPELWLEQNAKPGLETDVYAFGGLTLAVMSGSPPFFQINAPVKIILRIVREEHPRPMEHPTLNQNDPLWSLMRRCWAREPRMRPTIREVEFGLKRQKKPVDMVSGGEGISELLAEHSFQPPNPVPSLSAPEIQNEPTLPITQNASNTRYFMLLHNMMQQRQVSLLEATFPQGPRHSETWTTTVTVAQSVNGRGIGTYTAVANTKWRAREAASLQALIALGVDLNSLP